MTRATLLASTTVVFSALATTQRLPMAYAEPCIVLQTPLPATCTKLEATQLQQSLQRELGVGTSPSACYHARLVCDAQQLHVQLEAPDGETVLTRDFPLGQESPRARARWLALALTESVQSLEEPRVNVHARATTPALSQGFTLAGSLRLLHPRSSLAVGHLVQWHWQFPPGYGLRIDYGHHTVVSLLEPQEPFGHTDEIGLFAQYEHVFSSVGLHAAGGVRAGVGSHGSTGLQPALWWSPTVEAGVSLRWAMISLDLDAEVGFVLPLATVRGQAFPEGLWVGSRVAVGLVW